MEERDQKELYSKRVRVGKRTYFFDVKSTRASDYYLTITESRRYPQGDGFAYGKHKLFLYKEDFDKFIDALKESVDHVKTELLPGFDFDQYRQPQTPAPKEEEFGSDLKWE
ncbi:MAG: PUR family DNA/RNA-binding protein [Cytophagaceae bacterium]|nr:PUR family DNA/RNA-binding protein [Cytophagaceae bacterium]